MKFFMRVWPTATRKLVEMVIYLEKSLHLKYYLRIYIPN